MPTLKNGAWMGKIIIRKNNFHLFHFKVSTCTSIELNEALKEGYQVLRVYRVLEYKEADKELFRSYMREFIAEKIHSSGFGDGMLENPEARQQFIDECLALFGIKIDPSKMKPNKALRQLSKLFVNNLWGKLFNNILKIGT
jgi:hypothetical protein